MTRRGILGVDLGTRRIGLALSEEGIVARPLATIGRGEDLEVDGRRLAEIVRAHGVEELVVGLPLEADGREGPMALAARAWATDVAARLGLPVTLRDERLSSHLAETRLGPIGRGRSGGPPSRVRRDGYRARVDREAAAVILQDELDARQARDTRPA